MITILGAGGFVGSHLADKLERSNTPYFAPAKNDPLKDRDLGDVIYCIGLTADFRKRPLDTVDAHVCKLLDTLRDAQFSSILYLSSTRLYGRENDPAREDTAFKVNPQNPSDLYNISKLMGESLLHASGHHIRIARLSNVFGGDVNSDNFLSDVIRQAVRTGRVKLETALESEKDYISIEDVCDLLIRIASAGSHTVYNLASGVNVSNRQITQRLSDLTNCRVEVDPAAVTVKFPVISNEIVRSEFGYRPSGLLDEMEKLVSLYQNQIGES